VSTLYHETLQASVDAILSEGFRDGDPEPLIDNRRGVWFRDRDIRTRSDRILLAIETDISEVELTSFERDRRGAKDFREFFMPAARLQGRLPRVVERAVRSGAPAPEPDHAAV